MPTQPIVTKLVIDGVEVPYSQTSSPDESDGNTEIFETLALMDEFEQPNYIVTTSSAARQ